MKGLVAASLLSISGSLLVLGGPVNKFSTQTSSSKTSTATGHPKFIEFTSVEIVTLVASIENPDSTVSGAVSASNTSSGGRFTLSGNTRTSLSLNTSTIQTSDTLSHTTKISSSTSSSSKILSSTSRTSRSTSSTSRTTKSANSTEKSSGSTSQSIPISDYYTSSALSTSSNFTSRTTKSANSTEKSSGSTSQSIPISDYYTSSALSISPSFTSRITKSANSTEMSTSSTGQSTPISDFHNSSTSSISPSFTSRITKSANSTEMSTNSTGQSTPISDFHNSSTSSISPSFTSRTPKSANSTQKSTTSLSQSTATSIANNSSSSTPSDIVSTTSSAIHSLSTFSGPQDGSAPPWNLNNVSCHEMYLLNGSQQWAAVNGDSVVQAYSQMYSGNKLMCSDCFGMDKGACSSKDPGCQNGLRDLAMIANTTGHSRWDTGVAIFAQDGDDTDLLCDIGVGECSSSPKCELLDGPGAWALLKSIETMHNMLNNMYNSIQAAGDAAGHQMQAFSNIFAPVPSFKNDAIWLSVMIAIIGAILGAVSFGMFMPEVFGVGIALEGAAAAAVPLFVSTAVGGVTGAAAGIGENIFFFGQPAPGDTDSPLGTIISATLLTYSNLCDQLMAEGSYDFVSQDGKQNTTITLQNKMKDGRLMQANGNISEGFVAMQPIFEVIMFQQLALYTWQNLQTADVQSIPYIVYDNVPCDKLNVTTVPNIYTGEDDTVFGSDSILSFLPDIYNLDANMTYEGKCYWLLGAKPDGNRVFGKKVAPSFHCQGSRALPGATNKDLGQNAGIFANLSLKHWIIPSVLGWQQHHNQNGYLMASQNGQLVSDPLQPATVNIPVCEYIRNPNSPGVGCPKLNEHQTDKCAVYPPSTGVDQPGEYHDGWCGVHVDQYQRNEGNAINPLNNYQLSISINDANGIQVGQATKQSAANALSIVDSALPFNLVVFPGSSDDDTVKFWYSDQYWNSSTCGVGSYDHGMRQMDCGFHCPLPDGDLPVSATVAHPFPDVPTAAIGGDKIFLNTFISSTPAPTPTGPPPPPPPPTYATGQCGIHVVQYQKHEDNINPTGDYLIEATIFDGKQKPIGVSGQVPAPLSVPVPVPGLVSPFTITAGATDDLALVCKFNGKTFNLNQTTCGKHAIGAYDSGSRNIDCGFSC